jgi:glycerol-3-phosphate dehydrogenase
VYERAGQIGLEMPITAAVYQVLYENKAPLAAVNELMTRLPRSEEVVW